MCEAHAYLIKDGAEEKIMDSVDLVEFEGDQVRLVNIFGEQKVIKAAFKLYNNTERKILFEALSQ